MTSRSLSRAGTTGQTPKNFNEEKMSLTTPAIRASESNHWYTRDGVPQYTVEAKKGGQRNTTLRDARVMNLVPSVTTVLNVALSLIHI